MIHVTICYGVGHCAIILHIPSVLVNPVGLGNMNEYIRYNCAAISWCNSALELVKKHDWSDPLAKYRHAKKIRLLCEIASFHEKEDQKENWIVALRIAEVVLGTARSSWYE